MRWVDPVLRGSKGELSLTQLKWSSASRLGRAPGEPHL